MSGNIKNSNSNEQLQSTNSWRESEFFAVVFLPNGGYFFGPQTIFFLIIEIDL